MNRPVGLWVWATVGLLSGPLVAVAADWSMPPAAYVYQTAAGCPATRQPLLAPAPGPARGYDPCIDQMQAFLRARAEAYGADKQLLVIFGAAWCPSCQSLKIALPTPEVMQRVSDGKTLFERVHVLEIALSTLHNGRVTPVPSGQVVLSALQARPATAAARSTQPPAAGLRAIPFLAVVDPVTGRTSTRNLDDLQPAGRWNLAGLATVIGQADVASRGGIAAPAEPGWLSRQWRRWFGE